MEIKIPYYEDNTRISNSNIGMFIKYGAKYLKGYLDGTVEGLKGSFLNKGSMIHAWILQRDEFWNMYEVLNFEIPKSKQMKEFCEAWVDLDTELDTEVRRMKAYKKAYNNQKSDKVVLQETLDMLIDYEDYIAYLQTKKTKEVISFVDLTTVKQVEANIRAHKKANKLIYDVPDTFEQYNEFHINWDYPINEDTKLQCKSLIDRVLIDHTNKKIILIDLKTTSHLQEFSKSMKEFDYLRQLSFYVQALAFHLAEKIGADILNYELETYIVAIKNNDDYSVRVFAIDPDKIAERGSTLDNALKDIHWHQSTGQWDYSKEYYLSDGTEQLSYE